MPKFNTQYFLHSFFFRNNISGNIHVLFQIVIITDSGHLQIHARPKHSLRELI